MLSNVNVRALHQHFLHVELNHIGYEIDRLSSEISSLSYSIIDGPSQPAGLPPYSKAPDRYQVFSKRFFPECISIWLKCVADNYFKFHY